MSSGRIKNITQMAQLAGVSAGTVSRALADSPLISKKTRDRIQALAREHGFRPNILARNLRIKRAGAIGVLIPLGHEKKQHVSDPFFITLLGHLADALTEHGQDLLLSRVIPSNPDWLRDFVESGRVDGVILVGQSNEADIINQVAEHYRPMVVWGADIPDKTHCTVGTDNIKGGRIATAHLVERGCRDIVFLGDPGVPEIADRHQGYRDAMAAAGRSAAAPVPIPLTAELAYPAICAWLDGQGAGSALPDGIFAASDVIAISAMRALMARGHQVPDDVRIVGYDDLAIASHTLPPLTSVRQDLVAAASHLVDLLFRRMKGEDTGSIVMEPQLIVRGSS